MIGSLVVLLLGLFVLIFLVNILFLGVVFVGFIVIV